MANLEAGCRFCQSPTSIWARSIISDAPVLYNLQEAPGRPKSRSSRVIVAALFHGRGGVQGSLKAFF